jgi:hypothetical protein
MLQIGENFFPMKYKNFVVLFFKCKLQLIHNFLTKWPGFPLPRSPTNLEKTLFKKKIGRAAV